MPDLDGLLFRKEWINGRPCLTAADIHSEEWLERIKDQKALVLSGRRVRNAKHLAKLFCLLREVVTNCDVWPNERELLEDLKEATGLSQTRINPMTGRTWVKVGSISFEAMDQDEFTQWYEKAINLLATDVLQCTPQELQDHINALLGEDWRDKPQRQRRLGSKHGKQVQQDDGRPEPDGQG